MTREWKLKLPEKEFQKIWLRYKNSNLKLNCLVFANDSKPFQKHSCKNSTNQPFERGHRKVGLQISFEKKNRIYVKHRDASKSLNKMYEKIKKVYKINYLGEIIQPNSLHKKVNKRRSQKMKLAYQLRKDLYIKKISLDYRETPTIQHSYTTRMPVRSRMFIFQQQRIN